MIKFRKSCYSGLWVSCLVGALALQATVTGGGRPVPKPTTSAVTVDKLGNLFIADRIGLVRKLSADGVTTIVAGIGGWGYSGDGGRATEAQISATAVAIDSASNLLIAGINGGSAVRRVSPSGIISTFAGIGSRSLEPTGDGGPANRAQVVAQGLAIDAAGNVFIAGGNAIRKVAPNGIISTVVGTGKSGFSGDGGPAVSAQINAVQGDIALDRSDNLIIADSGNQRIRRVASNGTISTIAGSGSANLSGGGVRGGFGGDGGPGISAQLNNPIGVAVDAAGNVFIAEDANHRVRKLAPNGIITTFAGTGVSGHTGDGGPANSARLIAPRRLAIDSAGNLFIADETDNSVRKVNTAGVISTVYPVPARPGARSPAALSRPLNTPAAATVPGYLLLLAAAIVLLDLRFRHRIRMRK